jgi:hypothetical protein
MTKLPSEVVLEAVDEIPAPMSVIAQLAENAGAKDGVALVKGLVSEGRLVMIGEKKNARYCTARALEVARARNAKRRAPTRVIQG